MALQWMILSWVVATEAVVAVLVVLVTLPAPRLVKSRIGALASLLLQPLTGVLPFTAFQLLIFKAQRNVILCVLACLLFWCIYRICKYNKEIKELEEVEKRLKE